MRDYLTDTEADEVTTTDRRMLMSWKSGPAWPCRPSTRSLQAQVLVAAGEVLQAIERKQLRDVLPAWRRLTLVVGVNVAGAPVGSALRLGLTSRWDTLRERAITAMTNAQSVDAARHWRLADGVMRAAAVERVRALSTELAKAEELTVEDYLEDGPADVERLTAERLYFATFAYPEEAA